MRLLREIRYCPSQLDLLLPVKPMIGLCKELLQDELHADFRLQPAALYALMEAAESYLADLFTGKLFT